MSAERIFQHRKRENQTYGRLNSAHPLWCFLSHPKTLISKGLSLFWCGPPLFISHLDQRDGTHKLMSVINRREKATYVLPRREYDKNCKCNSLYFLKKTVEFMYNIVSFQKLIIIYKLNNLNTLLLQTEIIIQTWTNLMTRSIY